MCIELLRNNRILSVLLFTECQQLPLRMDIHLGEHLIGCPGILHRVIGFDPCHGFRLALQLIAPQFLKRPEQDIQTIVEFFDHDSVCFCSSRFRLDQK